MKEFGLFIGPQELSRGLRPDKHLDHGSGYFKSLINMRPVEAGLKGLEPIVDPISSPTATVVTWPFPMLLRDGETTLLAFDADTNPGNVLYSVNISDWSTSALSVFHAGTPANAWTFSTSGKPWQFTAFDSIWFLTNGTDLVFNHPYNSSDKILAVTGSVKVNALTKDTNTDRLLMGGLSGTYFTAGSNLWSDKIFPVWQQVNPGLTHEDQAFGNNWLFYSRPVGGSIDTPYIETLFFLDLLSATDESAVESLLLEALERNEWGFIPMPDDGEILAIKELDNNIIVYTSTAVYNIGKVQNGYAKPDKLLNFGIKGRGCVCGNSSFHTFINSNDELVVVSSNSINVRNYNEFLSNLSDTTTVAVYDPTESEFYFSDGAKAYLFTGYGLCEITKAPTGLTRLGGVLNGTSKTISAVTAFSMRTCSFDFGLRELNTIKALQVNFQSITSLKGQLGYRYRQDSVTGTTPLKAVNYNGVIYVKSTAPDNEILLQGTVSDATTARITYINGRRSTASKQATRGTTGNFNNAPNQETGG